MVDKVEDAKYIRKMKNGDRDAASYLFDKYYDKWMVQSNFENLPYKAISHGLYMLLSYRFGELIFSYVSFRFVIYTVLSAIVIPTIGRGFKRHQTI